MGSDTPRQPSRLSSAAFQSTLPVWGATGAAIRMVDNVVISIHAPRVGSDTRTPVRWTRPENFNPRSPCGERPLSRQLGDCCCEFQSTLPVWGATIGQRLPCPDATISIHAPRVGSDPVPTMRPTVITNFNPRSPCGERHRSTWRENPSPSISIHAPRVGSDISAAIVFRSTFRFQSTLRVWGATLSWIQ